MANNVIKRTWNQNKMVCIEDLTGMAFQSESGGHTFEISGTNDSGTAVSLSGTVEARFLRADNVKVTIAGTISSGKASVTLTSNCYTVAGRFSLTIFVTSNSQKVAVYSAVGNVAVTDGVSSGTVPPLVTDSIQTGSMTASGDVTVNGVLDVTPRRCSATLSSAGWYRAINMEVGDADVSRFSVATILDIYIGTNYSNNNNCLRKISLFGTFNTPSFVNETSKTTNANLINKIRYTTDSSNNGHIDIHYNTSGQNPVWLSFASHLPAPNQQWLKASTLPHVVDSPAGETVLTEYSFTNNTDGEISAPVSALSGASVIDSSCYRSGQVISYHTGMQSDTSSAINVSNGTVLATGLVPPAKRFITLGHYYHGNLTPLRCQVTTNGELIVYYSTGTIPSQNNPIVFEINYIAK